MIAPRFHVVEWHGEGRSLWYVMDRVAAASRGSKPACVETCRTREDADASAAWRNDAARGEQRARFDATTAALRRALGTDGSVSAAALDAARAAALEALRACGCLGFDAPIVALGYVLACADWIDRWDCRDEPALIAAVEHYKSLRLAARLAGVRS